MLEKRGSQNFRENFLKIFIEGASWNFNEKEDKEIKVQFIGNAIVGVIEWWLKSKSPLTPDEMSKQLNKLVV